MTNPTTQVAPGQGGNKTTLSNRKPRRQYSLKSSAIEAQRQRCIDALRTGPRTTYDLRRIGIYYPPARIKELRNLGYDIQTELVDLYDRDGYLHPSCARYWLRSEPEPIQ